MQCTTLLQFHISKYICIFIFSRQTFISFVAFHFQLLGLGILIPGLLMVLNVDVINDKVIPLMQQVSVGVFNLGDLAKGLSITLIIFGSFVLIVSTLGACGACCQNRVCLGIVSITITLTNLESELLYIVTYSTQGRIQDFKLGGALKIMAPSGAQRENVWGISYTKSRFYAKNHVFFQF